MNKEALQPVAAPALDAGAAADRARWIRERLPEGELFEGHDWRVALEPFPIEKHLANSLEMLGRVLLKFYQAVNRLYRQSAEGRQPDWVAELLDQGKPAELIRWQRTEAFRHDVPRVIRPDLILTDEGWSLTELDSVPGGIGLTAWLNQTYSRLPDPAPRAGLLGGEDGIPRGFEGIFGSATRVHLMVSDEAATYRPEMEWMATQLGLDRFGVRNARFTDWKPGEAVYRFFELFDLANVPAAHALFTDAAGGSIRLTPPPKAIFEEKLLFALLWNRNLHGFWFKELGEGFLNRLQQVVPYSWVLDPTPLSVHAAYPHLNVTDWSQLKALSQRERELILKISGFADTAWGSRGVFLGSDMSMDAWSQAVDLALRSWPTSAYVLQRFHKPRAVPTSYFDFETGRVTSMQGRVRLCPYYFVHGDGEDARPHLGGVLATICPADKKLIHGMRDAVMAPCVAADQ